MRAAWAFCAAALTLTAIVAALVLTATPPAPPTTPQLTPAPVRPTTGAH